MADEQETTDDKDKLLTQIARIDTRKSIKTDENVGTLKTNLLIKRDLNKWKAATFNKATPVAPPTSARTPSDASSSPASTGRRLSVRPKSGRKALHKSTLLSPFTQELLQVPSFSQLLSYDAEELDVDNIVFDPNNIPEQFRYATSSKHSRPPSAGARSRAHFDVDDEEVDIFADGRMRRRQSLEHKPGWAYNRKRRQSTKECRKSHLDALIQERVRRLTCQRWRSVYLKHSMASREEKKTGLVKECSDQTTDHVKRSGYELFTIFRRKARIVRLCVAMCIRLRRYVVDAGLMDNSVRIVTRYKGKDVDFNMNNFRLKKEMKVHPTVVAMLLKASSERTPEDITAIGRLMRRNLPSFRKYTSDMQNMMCKIVRYMRCEKGRVVLRRGHIGYSVYFINSGSVSVVMDKDDEGVFAKKKVLPLRKGACFGEIALLQDTRRSATVVCAEETEFMVVDKDDFKANGLHKQMDEEFKFRYKFFRDWPLFKDASEEKIRSVAYWSRTEEFGHHKILIKDTLFNNNLWFIVKGSCEVIRIVGRVSSGRRRGMSAEKKEGTDILRALARRKRDKIKQPTNEAGKETIVLVDVLRDGQCYGADSLLDEDDPPPIRRSFSFVSCGCVAIHIPLTNFRKLFPPAFLQHLHSLARPYPRDSELLQTVAEMHSWEQYRKTVVADVLLRLQDSLPFEKKLRGSEFVDESQEYLKTKKKRTKSAAVPRVSARVTPRHRPWTCPKNKKDKANFLPSIAQKKNG